MAPVRPPFPCPRSCRSPSPSHSALLRGYAAGDETCEVAGFGPVSPQVVLDILETEDPFLKAVLTKGKDVVGVAHLGRRPTAHQRSALDLAVPHLWRPGLRGAQPVLPDRPPRRVGHHPCLSRFVNVPAERLSGRWAAGPGLTTSASTQPTRSTGP